MRIRLLLLYSLLILLVGVVSTPVMAAVTPKVVSKHSEGLEVGAIDWVKGHPDADFETAHAADWPWQPLEKPNLRKQPQGAWLRFTLESSSALSAGTWYLSLKWPVLDDVQVRLFYPEQRAWGSPMRAGDHVPMDDRPLESQNLVFPFELAQGGKAVVYMHVQGREFMAMPLVLSDEAGFTAEKITDVAMISLFFGGMLVILLYNSSLFVFTRDVAYLLYVAYLLSALFYVLAITGFGQLFLWPDMPPIARRFYGLSAALCFFTPLVFASRFLSVRRYGGWVWLVTWGLMAYWAVTILVTLFAPSLANYLAAESVALAHCILTMAAVINLWIRGNRSARLFIIAWSTLLLATIIHLLALEGLLALNAYTLYGQLIGMFAEFVLLSMALAERINHDRDRRIVAQQSALQASEALGLERESRLRAQQQTLDLQMRANEALEARVSERTRALEDAKRGLERVNEQLTRMSITDALTQLSNRGHFDLMIDEEIRCAQRVEKPLSVLLLDIDHFKQVNDTYEHPFGDECLRLVAAALKQHGQRAGDVVARYGGEEFVIALPGVDSRQAGEQAERIRMAVAALHPTCGEARLDLTISIGVATLEPPMSCSATQLLAAADAALYRAKRNGRNQVAVAEPDEAT
ncbi:diguanylate cyclase [Stutzerimonas stutzeri]|uniref:diguanylate cyclase n=1 Tax=Stutzerimonas stutzeri TaxID=316 RepID=W8RFH1_STUST|nr:diguanylate cyclase [Stutzerimonas stutzeri]AHL77267.1 diguanylate cyclase [Stutzerimonas stutzeri]MCQ4330160.1 diguanylate cyclase [Stutzerimonas stutzeri]